MTWRTSWKKAGELRPTGHIVDSLECVLYALWETSGECDEAIIKAANMGGDADTIASICGDLAGVLYGFAILTHINTNTNHRAISQRRDARRA